MTKQITAVQLNKMLAQGEVKFAFEKKDGTIRQAIGTRNINMIPIKDLPKQGPTNVNTVNYYDLDKKAWRGVSVFAPVFV